MTKGIIPVSVRLGSTRKDITKKEGKRVRYINVILENNGKKLENSRSGPVVIGYHNDNTR